MFLTESKRRKTLIFQFACIGRAQNKKEPCAGMTLYVYFYMLFPMVPFS